MGRNYSTISKGDSQLVEEIKKDFSLSNLAKQVEDNPNKVFTDLTPYYSNIKTLIYSYEQLKSNTGMMTHGVTPDTLDGIDLKWFSRMSEQLSAGKYKFCNIRRV